MNSKSGNVNSVTLKTKLIWRKKRNQKIKRLIIQQRQLLKFWIRKFKDHKTSASFSVSINLDLCVFLHRSKAKSISWVTRKTNCKISRNLVMDLISSYKEKETSPMSAECNACKQQSIPKSMIWAMEQLKERLVQLLLTER